MAIGVRVALLLFVIASIVSAAPLEQLQYARTGMGIAVAGTKTVFVGGGQPYVRATSHACVD